MKASILLIDVIEHQEVENCYNSVIFTFGLVADNRNADADRLGNKVRVHIWIVKPGRNASKTHDEVTLSTWAIRNRWECKPHFGSRARKSGGGAQTECLHYQCGPTKFHASLRRLMGTCGRERNRDANKRDARSVMDRLRPSMSVNVSPTDRRVVIETSGTRARESKGGRPRISIFHITQRITSHSARFTP